MSPPPELHTARLRLFVPDERWIPELIRFHRENQDHLEPWGPPMPGELFERPWWEDRLRRNEAERAEGRSLKLVFVRAAEDRLIGTVALFDIERGPVRRQGMLGYGLAREAEGRGLMTEAARAVVEHGFSALGLHRIWTTHDAENHRSERVLQRLGFRVEGRLRKSDFLQGTWRDQILVARLADEAAP